MDIKPVKNMALPQYPKREEVSAGQIKDTLPRRWAASPAAKIALASLAAMSLAGMSACDAAPGGAEITPALTTEASVSQSPIVSDIPMGDVAAPMISVAPLFLHGEGLGAFGCMMETPPAFLSEDEALSVINNVAKDYGLEFTAGDAPVLDNVLQPVPDTQETGLFKPKESYEAFTPDFADAEHGVSIEFVSMWDAKDWNCGNYKSTACTHDTREAAAQISEALEDAASDNYIDATVGVVYDPLISDETAPDDGLSEAKTQLAAQVKDFCEWLKAQGVI
jgi:hypothetical protein